MELNDIKGKIRGTIGKEIFFYEKVGSTNTVASDLAEKVGEGSVVLADSQEKGKGRRGRTWISPPGVNIYLSVILKPEIELKDATLLTLMAAVACANALRKVTGLDITIKWPNDLMFSDKKLGGILTELKTVREKILFAVTGIGINVNMDMNEFPEDIVHIATSIKQATGRIFSREEIVGEVLNEMDKWYMILQDRKRNILLAEWQRLTSTIGKEVMVIAGRETYTGLADSIDDEGMLVLRLSSGETKRISSGDLKVLR